MSGCVVLAMRLSSEPLRGLCDVCRRVDLISDALPFSRLWYGEPNAVSNAIGYSKFRSLWHDSRLR
jgi:hypothetical protein